MTLQTRITGMSRELKLFAATSILMGIAYSIYDSTFNNFINDSFALTGFQRALLEVPRELPGFLVVFVSALLSFLCSRRLGAFALLFGALGALLIGFTSSTYGAMMLCLFIYSMGMHLFMPLTTSIGMELSHEGQTGRRLGQLNALRNFATILGSFVVFVGFRFLGFQFEHSFLLTATGLGVAGLIMFLMKPDTPKKSKTFLTLHKEYRLYYYLNIISGSRKQIFLNLRPVGDRHGIQAAHPDHRHLVDHWGCDRDPVSARTGQGHRPLWRTAYLADRSSSSGGSLPGIWILFVRVP